MDTSKRTKELPMTFPEPSGMVYLWLSNHKGSFANHERGKPLIRKPLAVRCVSCATFGALKHLLRVRGNE